MHVRNPLLLDGRHALRWKFVLFFGSVAYCLATSIHGQESEKEDSEYIRVVNERAQKIVSRLGLKDSDQERRVRDLVAIFYRDLHATHANRDAKLKATSGSVGSIRSAEQIPVAQIRAAAEAEQFRHHYALIGKLGTELNGDQIDKVKDGLTYEVAPKTYQQYLKLHPALTAEQQRTILAMLLEAREHAMDGGSSEEKHAIFGKYKGRINNYLSAEGFDAKKAERELKERQSKQ